ncbi:MAG: GCN5-related N-acetyltransferase [Erythrobacter sp.]|uniref:GCN5-related N-acetyltransferase n=1 Tax=Erythrobacter sp. TaxID=1042 RepID=UPI003C710164
MTKARKMLEAKWFELTRSMMPAIAKERDWPVRFDHCFQRILLDNACGGPWREQIEAPAYANASDALLHDAIDLGRRAIAGEADLAQLNRQSLEWRGKGGN